MVGLAAMIFMKTMETGDCSNEIAQALKQIYEFDYIGNLTIMRHPQFFDDLSYLSEQYTAFQGIIKHLFLLSTFNVIVTIILPKEKYLDDYRVPWKKETLELTDNFYSILRTMYRYC